MVRSAVRRDGPGLSALDGATWVKATRATRATQAVPPRRTPGERWAQCMAAAPRDQYRGFV